MKKQTRRQRKEADKRFESQLKEAEAILAKAADELRQAESKIK